MEIHHSNLRKKYLSLIESDYISFNEVASKKNIMGVYIIYSPEERIEYIGSTNKFNIRFGTDLKHESTHTLVKKLLKNELFENRSLAVNYLINDCKFKIEICETKREAEALEHFAIWLLNPKYNQ
ncbi:GIY-YIG nuclease family protein [Flavobacterium enshiense]|uniref:GIY-YIG domain-containing protein n=1 Tax=Flavobacterium enshiense DK69 TaxID=1107311 RepID=A0A0A2MMB5_9FLAO|nr:GIY-YIG nuclease family protein [Flavobacterium enshiense]KGO92618.1 hypothetical protein Q767_15605 [Flavobacterium enshiense DK69]